MEKETKTNIRTKLDATFENLEVWQEAAALAAQVYESFRACRDFGFRDQVQRAAISISSNIAEGYERSSNAEFVRFLDIARGSCGEVRSQLHVAVRVGILPPESGEPLLADATRLSKRIARLMIVRRRDFI
ncbi:MAG TPA: four helix bundle protein [Opitutaceae bacterium]|nr:four helix bundle protein [Opitutaceae bacterium]